MTDQGALHAFHRFHQVHKSLYLFFSKNSNVMLFSFSFNFWKGIKKKKKNQIMSFFESLGDSIGEGFANAGPWNFVSNKAHQGASLFFLLFFGFIRMYSYLYSLFISTSEIFIEKFLAKYHCILYLFFNVVNDSKKKELTQKIDGRLVKVKKKSFVWFFFFFFNAI